MSEGDLTHGEASDHVMDFELADEEQVIAEMAGRVTDKYVYTFRQGGQDVTGLSLPGTNWAVREYAKQGEVIRVVGKPEIMLDPSDPEYIIVIVTAQRFAVNRESGKEIALDSTIGIKRQAKFIEKKKYNDQGEVVGKEMILDGFYLEKCVSKATRNAKQALIPADFVKKLISRALDSKNGKAVQGKGQPQGRPQQGGQPSQGAQPAPQARPIQPQGAPAAAAATKAAQVSAPAAPAPVAQSPAPPPVVQQAAPPPPAVAAAPAPAPVAAAPAPAPAVSAPPAAATVGAPPAAAAPAAAEPSKDVMVQKLDAVLKAVFATQDTGVSRRGLQVLTGYASPADMDVPTIKSLGNVLNSVVKKQARVNQNQVVRLQDNAVIWQGPPVPEAAQAPVSGADDAMF